MTKSILKILLEKDFPLCLFFLKLNHSAIFKVIEGKDHYFNVDNSQQQQDNQQRDVHKREASIPRLMSNPAPDTGRPILNASDFGERDEAYQKRYHHCRAVQERFLFGCGRSLVDDMEINSDGNHQHIDLFVSGENRHEIQEGRMKTSMKDGHRLKEKITGKITGKINRFREN